jgi:phosphatidylserine/phosphatidylglycerophosphate/cardiolipin synthase-like enzyme
MLVADNTYLFLGSENFSSNSMLKNRELGLIISNTPIADTLETTFESDWNEATPFTITSS